MYVRLKQRLLFYAVSLLLVFLVGKLLYVSHKCKEQTGASAHKHSEDDGWNLNEHGIESNIANEIERLKRHNGVLRHHSDGANEKGKKTTQHEVDRIGSWQRQRNTLIRPGDIYYIIHPQLNHLISVLISLIYYPE